MIKILAALFFGYLLVALEAIVPGGVLGLLGFVCLLASSYFAHLEYGGWMIPLIVFLIGGFGGVLLVFFQFKWLSQSKFGKNMFVHATSGGVQKEDPLQELVGRNGHTETDHHPEGLSVLMTKHTIPSVVQGFYQKGQKLKLLKLMPFA